MYCNLGPIDIECDAPLYSVVEACGTLGFQSPLDVRWCRTSNFLGRQLVPDGGFHPLRWLFGSSRSSKTTCTCGQPRPELGPCTFKFESGKEGHYLLGQCPRCRTMFWEEASVPSRKTTELERRREV
jgi:hypothetical protein